MWGLSIDGDEILLMGPGPTAGYFYYEQEKKIYLIAFAVYSLCLSGYFKGRIGAP
jgi:hypothetical protein